MRRFFGRYHGFFVRIKKNQIHFSGFKRHPHHCRTATDRNDFKTARLSRIWVKQSRCASSPEAAEGALTDIIDRIKLSAAYTAVHHTRILTIYQTLQYSKIARNGRSYRFCNLAGIGNSVNIRPAFVEYVVEHSLHGLSITALQTCSLRQLPDIDNNSAVCGKFTYFLKRQMPDCPHIRYNDYPIAFAGHFQHAVFDDSPCQRFVIYKIEIESIAIKPLAGIKGGRDSFVAITGHHRLYRI